MNLTFFHKSAVLELNPNRLTVLVIIFGPIESILVRIYMHHSRNIYKYTYLFYVLIPSVSLEV